MAHTLTNDSFNSTARLSGSFAATIALLAFFSYQSSSGGSSNVVSGCGTAGATSGDIQVGGSSGAGGSGGATVAFPLRQSSTHRYLVDQSGTPFLIQGDAAWSLMVQLRQTDAETYLEDRRKRGFNLLMINLIEHHFADNPPKNAYGNAPFTRSEDFSTPNEAYFAQADWVVQRALDKGMAVLLCPAYLGFNGGDEGWYAAMVANGADKLRAYGRYVGQRYKGYNNIVWLMGGDYTPPSSGVALVNAVAEGIREQDTVHVMSAHWGPESSSIDVGVSGWLNLNAMYTYQPSYLRALPDFSRSSSMPNFLIESAYEGENGSTSQSLRAQAYYALLSGGAGQIFGNGEIWKFSSAWAGQLGSSGAKSMSYLYALFATHAWYTLVPDASNQVLTSGQGSKGGTDYALLARSNDGKLAIAYLPSARDVRVDLTRLSGPVRARWFDPSSGAFTTISGSPFATSGSVTFRPPGSNADGSSDWVLVLEGA